MPSSHVVPVEHRTPIVLPGRVQDGSGWFAFGMVIYGNVWYDMVCIGMLWYVILCYGMMVCYGIYGIYMYIMHLWYVWYVMV
jgi:hypothetical protein